ncbi:MAG: hypothetical protein RJA10_30 [Pseudomonadota bacterium]|jgi:hypothetical protein
MKWRARSPRSRLALLKASLGVAAALALPGVGVAASPEPPAAGTTARPLAGWALNVRSDQPIRIRRKLEERTPDGQAMGTAQIQQGVNPWAQLIVYAVTYAVANQVGRKSAASSEELIVSTDQSVGAAVAVADMGQQKRFENQDDVNKVIRPYAEALAGTSLLELLSSAKPAWEAKGLILGADVAPAQPDQSVRIAPVFVFATDQRSVHVDATVGFGEPSADTKGPDKRVVRVVVHSAANDSFDISDYWLRDGARSLRSTLASLVAEAIDVAHSRFSAAVAPAQGRQRTVRLRLGAESIFVRGVVAASDCNRVIVDTLEGHLMVVPAGALRDRDLLPERCTAGG